MCVVTHRAVPHDLQHRRHNTYVRTRSTLRDITITVCTLDDAFGPDIQGQAYIDMDSLGSVVRRLRARQTTALRDALHRFFWKTFELDKPQPCVMPSSHHSASLRIKVFQSSAKSARDQFKLFRFVTLARACASVAICCLKPARRKVQNLFARSLTRRKAIMLFWVVKSRSPRDKVQLVLTPHVCTVSWSSARGARDRFESDSNKFAPNDLMLNAVFFQHHFGSSTPNANSRVG